MPTFLDVGVSENPSQVLGLNSGKLEGPEGEKIPSSSLDQLVLTLQSWLGMRRSQGEAKLEIQTWPQDICEVQG